MNEGDDCVHRSFLLYAGFITTHLRLHLISSYVNVNILRFHVPSSWFGSCHARFWEVLRVLRNYFQKQTLLSAWEFYLLHPFLLFRANNRFHFDFILGSRLHNVRSEIFSLRIDTLSWMSGMYRLCRSSLCVYAIQPYIYFLQSLYILILILPWSCQGLDRLEISLWRSYFL
jgi:hypothetical protein